MENTEVIKGSEPTVYCDYKDYNRIHDEFWESFRLLDVIMLMTDRAGKVLDISEAGSQLLGKSREDIIGQNWFDTYVPERFRADAREAHREKLDSGDAGRTNHDFVLRGDGTEVELHWQNTVVRKGGKPFALLSQSHVTNYSKHYRDATLRGSILDSALDKVLLTDLQGTVLYANKVVDQVGGWPQEEILGKSIFGTIVEDDQDVADYIKEGLEEKRVTEVQLNVKRKDGSTYPAQLAVRSLSFGSEQYATVVIRDIRQIIAAQEALAASERRYKAYVENAKDVVFTLDADGVITYISPQIEEFGYSTRDLTGKNFNEAFSRFGTGGIKGLSFETNASPFVFGALTPEGRRVWFEGSGKPVPAGKGSSVGFVGTVREVTDRVESELERERLLEAEKEIAEIGSDLLACDKDSLDVVLKSSLGRVSQIIGADSGLISNIELDGTVSNTHKWAKNGVTVPELKIGSLSQASVLTESLAVGRVIVVDSSSEADDTIRKELAELGWPDGGRMIISPFMVEDKPVGMVTVIRNGGSEENFVDSDVTTVKIFAGLIGSVMINRENANRLAEEASWNKKLSEFSAAFLSGTASGESFTAVFRSSCADIAEMFGFNRAVIYAGSSDQVHVLADWSEPGLDAPKLEDHLSVASFSDIADLGNDVDIAVEDVEDLPEAAREQIFGAGKSRRLKSLFVMTLRLEGEFVGFLAMLSYDKPVVWTEVGAGRMRTMSDILTSALVRRKAVRDLDKRLELETAVSEAVAELAMARIDSLQFKAAQAMSRLAGAVGAGGAGFYCVDSIGKLGSYATWQESSATASLAFKGIEGLAEGTTSMVRLEEGDILTVTAAQGGSGVTVEDDFSSRLDPASGFVCIPTHREGKLASVLCMSASSELVSSWNQRDLLPLKTFGDALFSSYARVKSDEAMKELERLRIKFIHVVSHQLRTPLNSIRWSLEALLAGELGEMNPEQKDFIKVVYDAELKIISRIRDMIIALDIEEGRVSLSREEGVMEALWGSVMSVAKAKADKLGVNFSYRPPREQLPAVFVDAEKIRFVMESMVSNALSYTKTGGTVEVSLRQDDGQVRFEVTDTGVGIPKIEEGEIFKRFFRASNASVMVQDASGLSLSISKYYVDRHGGEIGFSSEQEKGSSFWFTLPIG